MGLSGVGQRIRVISEPEKVAVIPVPAQTEETPVAQTEPTEPVEAPVAA